ncbi:lipoprotein [Streptomyces sp. XD-27]|uniref:lipoprotein n=1 Tax=Streptomyces sp. XD-27 TaxID=3062779 RepID=UPI0026F447D0|nr:lipoprotein [Streptomyces sp. XD-27]WKX70903.1 lipoprotein [Streptomyces sp. XD-27]
MYDMHHFSRAGRAVAGAVAAAAMLGALTGCSTSGDGDKGKATGKDKVAGKGTDKDSGGGHGGTKSTASSGRQLGGKGSACVLPVTFDVAKSWKPKAVEPIPAGKDDHGFNELLHQGGVQMVCEIDAKPAGHIGFLQVWTGPKSAADDKPRAVLERYLAEESDDVRKTTYRDIEVGDDGVAAVEVVYSLYSKLMEESRQVSALAVATPQGPVLLRLGGLDTEEHKDMLPALELAKESMTLSAAG